MFRTSYVSAVVTSTAGSARKIFREGTGSLPSHVMSMSPSPSITAAVALDIQSRTHTEVLKTRNVRTPCCWGVSPQQHTKCSCRKQSTAAPPASEAIYRLALSLPDPYSSPAMLPSTAQPEQVGTSSACRCAGLGYYNHARARERAGHPCASLHNACPQLTCLPSPSLRD